MLGMLVPVRLSQAEPVQLAPRLPETGQVLQGSPGIAVLPGVDAELLAMLEEPDNTLGSVPRQLVLAEQLVEMSVAVDRVAADD